MILNKTQASGSSFFSKLISLAPKVCSPNTCSALAVATLWRTIRNKVTSKAGNKKRAICFATLQQNELNSNVAGFTTHVSFKPVLRQIWLQGLFFVVGKTRDIASQLVLQKSHKTSCTFFAARFTVPQGKTKS